MTDERVVATGTARHRPDAGPDDPAIRLAVVNGRLIRLLRRQVPTEIGPGSLSVLGTLHRCGPMRLGDLAAREGVAPPTLTRIVAVLEEAGYLRRETDSRDRRAVQVSVTETGSRVVADTFAARAAVLRARLVDLSDDERRALLEALPVLETLADDSH